MAHRTRVRPAKAEASPHPSDGATSKPRDSAAELKANSYVRGQMTATSFFAAQRVVMAAEKRGAAPLVDNWDGLTDRLQAFGAKVNGGDMTEVERMLAHQAVALQSIFTRLVEGAMSAEMVSSFDLNLRYGLRAQAQCRATLETLAAIKNPSVVFARQANLTTGPQQINNGVAPRARGGSVEFDQTEQSGGQHELRQDGGTSALALGDDSPMAPMGAIDGAADAGRQGAVLSQRMEGRHAGSAAAGRPGPARSAEVRRATVTQAQESK